MGSPKTVSAHQRWEEVCQVSIKYTAICANCAFFHSQRGPNQRRIPIDLTLLEEMVPSRISTPPSATLRIGLACLQFFYLTKSDGLGPFAEQSHDAGSQQN